MADMKRLDKRTKTRLVEAIERFAETGYGDVKRLKGWPNEARLRIGKWRVRFIQQIDSLTILRVLPRGKAYRT